MIAQVALESDYSRSTLARPPIHNLFGIKASAGQDRVNMSTSEYINGQWIYPSENFKRYPNYSASMLDNAQLIRYGNDWDPTYYQGAWIENTNNYADATESLEGRYATDPAYDDKLNRIIQENDLTQYDSVKTTAPQTENTHTVSNGDTLYNIANRYGMSVEELKALNGLNTNRISLGDTLQVTGSAQTVQSGSTHTVSSGDTLYNIANRYGMSVSELQQVNGLSSNNIRLGQTLQVTGRAQPVQTGSTHTVSSGDTLYNIANRYGMLVSELQQLNDLSSNNISLGQTLQVTGNGQASSSENTHTVVAGDTLYNIAKRNNTTVAALESINGVNSADIKIGQTLTVNSDVQGQNTHIVAPGDTLYNISNRYGLSVEVLQAMNNLSGNAIKLGQELVVK